MFGHSNDSFAEQTSLKEINLKEYTLAQERFDERFGLIFFMKSKSSARTLFVKERSAALPQDQIHEIHSRLRVTDHYLLNIYGLKQVPESGIFQIYFEEFSTDLQAEIKRHLAEKTRFSEAELYAILYSAVSALAVLEQHNISHNFIVPMNILKFDKDLYKLHDNFTINNRSYLYNHALRGQYLRYVAPELFESLTRQKETPDRHDPHKADIFALGMCLLDAGLLSTEGNFINKKLMILDEKILQQSIKKFGDLYSPAMMQILQDMLFPDPSKRPSPITLYKRLPGKPLQKNQAAGGRKRKLLDQIINSASPEKYDAVLNSRLSYGSPHRFSADEIQIQARTSYPGGFREQQSYLDNQSECLKRASPGKHVMTYESQYPPNPETDISRVNVSHTIKNDPLLSQFVKKLVNPAYNIRGSPTRSEHERSTFMNIPSASLPTPLDNQFHNFSPSLTPIQPYGLKTEIPNREIETRSFYTSDPFSVTHKPNNQQNYPIHDQTRTISDTYRSNLSYPSVDTYGRGPVSQGRALGYLQGVDFPPGYSAEQIQTLSNRGSADRKSKMDEIISKALERSSANLYLSHQVSGGVGSAQPVHHEEHNVETTSFGQLSQQKLPGLTTVYERVNSEDFTTPGGSKVIDALQSRQNKIERDNSLEMQQQNAGQLSESNLMNVVNNQE